MPRQQIQLPGVTQATPVARQVDTFTGTKLSSPIPKEVLDLSKFSSAIAAWVGRATEESKQRSIAAGEADVELGKIYGSGLIETKESEKSRKSFKELQKQGEILASEDPWYRIGVFSAEGRRVGMTVQSEVLKDSVIQEMSNPVDEKGNFRPFDDNIDEEFDRRVQPYLNAPALQTIYGQRAAAGIIKDARAAFHLRVSKARDENLQQYYEGEAIGQLTALLETAHDAADSDPSTRSTMIQGFENIKDEMLRKSNVPEPRKVLHAALSNYVNHALDLKKGGPEEALRRIDFIRDLSVGRGVSVMTDESAEGIAFRGILERMESQMVEAKDREDSQERQRLTVERTEAGLRYEKVVSETFANAPSVHQAWQSLQAMAEDRSVVDPAYRTMFLNQAKEQYRALTEPMPLTQEQRNQVYEMMNDLPLGDVDEAIDAMPGVDALGRAELHEIVRKKKEFWETFPSVRDAHENLVTVSKNATAGLSPDAAAGLNEQIAGINREMSEEIRRLYSRAAGKDAAKVEADIAKIVDKANSKVQKLQENRANEERSFNTARFGAWNKGQSFLNEIEQAYAWGTITEAQADAYRAEDARQRSPDEFISASRQVVSLYAKEKDPLTGLGGSSADAISEAVQVAEKKAREWFKTERKNYNSMDEAKEAFGLWRKDNIDPEVKKIFEEAKAPAARGTQPETTAKAVKDALTFPKIGTTAKQRVLSQYADPKGDSFTRNFVDAWGNPKKVLQSQVEARAEAALFLEAGYADKNPKRFTDIMRTGFATFDELSKGSIDVNTSRYGAFRVTRLQGTLTFSTKDYDVWDTPIASSYGEMEKLLEVRREDIRAYAEKAGITGEKFTEWLQVQAVKASAIEGKYK